MLYGGPIGELEVRRSGGRTRLRGRFPYNSLATLSDGGKHGGKPRKERFAPHSFKHSVDSPEQEVHLLVGHSFDKPLASKTAGLVLTDSADALEFEATLSDAVLSTSYAQDALALLSAGLVGGISPGFRIPPARTVPNAEEVTQENPSQGTAIIRTIRQAILYELSLVVRPAYQDTSVEQETRNWNLDRPRAINCTPGYRWRR